jgi:hypothetical protein
VRRARRVGRLTPCGWQVNSRKETVIDCEMAEDKQEIFFNFSAPFEIHGASAPPPHFRARTPCVHT